MTTVKRQGGHPLKISAQVKRALVREATKRSRVPPKELIGEKLFIGKPGYSIKPGFLKE